MEDLRLVSINYGQLSEWRALLAGTADTASALRTILGQAHPVPDPLDVLILPTLKASMPVVVWLPVALRVDPASYVQQAVATYGSSSPDDLDFRLQDMSRNGEPYYLLTNPDVILGYYSQHFRIALNGMAGEGITQPRYDGDPVLVDAMSWAPDPKGLSRVAYSPQAVADISTRLTAFDDSAYPQGDLGPLFEYVEDFVDPELFSRPVTLGQLVQGELESLREIYSDAAAHGDGVLVLPPSP